MGFSSQSDIVCLLPIFVTICAVFDANGEIEGPSAPQPLEQSKLLIVTVATERTDGFERYERSIREFGLEGNLKVLGMGDEWKGGQMDAGVGGGVKVSILAEALKEYENQENTIIMFTDSYDVVVNADEAQILEKFRTEMNDARVVFSAEGVCWPDARLASNYPIVKSGKRYLCSGSFMGYAPDIYAIVIHHSIKDTDDDQLYYTKLFLDPKFREEHSIILDNDSKIFQNLNGAYQDVLVETKADHGVPGLHNIAYNTRPLVIHGNGPSKIKLNEIGNYLGKSWSDKDGCIECRENRIDLADKSVSELPTVTMAVFVEKPTPFLEEFFAKLLEGNNNYPLEKISLFLHNRIAYHNAVVDKFIKENSAKFAAAKVFETAQDEETDDAEREARTQSISHAIGQGSDYYFSVDSEAHMDNPDFLKLLIEQNRPILAPKLSQPGKMWSNFWGSVSDSGWYARSFDYHDIVHYKKLGVWNVPLIMNAILVRKTKLKALEKAYNYDRGFDPSMSFAKYCRNEGHFMFVDNLQKYGHLINPDIFDTTKLRPELWEIDNNRLDWEQRYLHPEYYKYLNDIDLPQLCPDVYDFPFFSGRMCWDIIDSMENFGMWSNGNNEDTRIAGGYENVPTRDIHMKQIGFHNEWLVMLNRYGRPMQEKVFTGYFHNPVESHMMFVVRYKPDEQASLRPHHDASTYTLDISLNRHGQDYEGGGVRFVRYNCSVIGHGQGWSILMPGRLTHYHEGLTTTKGTRYIAISFINP